ncbi:MAG: HyaD/HybD family hydrogenase maturation endopeptidase [Nitrospinota bacterium]
MILDNKVTILGIGNILRKDDGFGVRAIEELTRHYIFPSNVNVIDGGTSGLALLPHVEESQNLIVLDAIKGDGEAGTLYRFSLDEFKLTIGKKISLHDMGFLEVMALAEINDSLPNEVTIIGTKPQNIDEDSMVLTDPVANAIKPTVKMVLKELKRYGIELVEQENIDYYSPFNQVS